MGKLTAKGVASIIAKGEKAMVCDGLGLYLQITPPNGASWILRAKVHGRSRYISIGPANVFSLADAREEALKFKKAIA